MDAMSKGSTVGGPNRDHDSLVRSLLPAICPSLDIVYALEGAELADGFLEIPERGGLACKIRLRSFCVGMGESLDLPGYPTRAETPPIVLPAPGIVRIRIDSLAAFPGDDAGTVRHGFPWCAGVFVYHGNAFRTSESGIEGGTTISAHDAGPGREGSGFTVPHKVFSHDSLPPFLHLCHSFVAQHPVHVDYAEISGIADIHPVIPGLDKIWIEAGQVKDRLSQG